MPRFGWAFLLAWVSSIFYTQILEDQTFAQTSSASVHDLPMQVFFFGLPVLSSTVTIVLTVVLERRLGSPIQNPIIRWLAPLLMALGTPFLFSQGGSQVATMLLFVMGAMTTGVGSGIMWVMWGEYYARISQGEVESIAPVSAVGAAILVLLVSALSGWVAVVVVICYPLASGLCLNLSWREAEDRVRAAEFSGQAEQQVFEGTRAHALSHPWLALNTIGRAGFGILTASIFVCLLGSLWQAGGGGLMLFQVALVVSLLFLSIVSVISLRGPRRVSVNFLFRWMCPLLVTGFAAVIIWGQSWGEYAAYVISLAARFSFCLITQMFFAHYAATGRTTAVQAYGFGWIFVHFGDFLGVLSMVLLGPAMATGAVASYQIAAMLIALLTILTMFILNKSGSYSVEDEGGGQEGLRAPASDSAGLAAARRPCPAPDAFRAKVRLIGEQRKLTQRELEVFELLARGRSVPFIRDELIISKDTAATHVKHIYAKLDVHTRQELINLTQK